MIKRQTKEKKKVITSEGPKVFKMFKKKIFSLKKETNFRLFGLQQLLACYFEANLSKTKAPRHMTSPPGKSVPSPAMDLNAGEWPKAGSHKRCSAVEVTRKTMENMKKTGFGCIFYPGVGDENDSNHSFPLGFGC